MYHKFVCGMLCTTLTVEPLNCGHYCKCPCRCPCFNVLSFLEDEVHGETDNGKANANAGEDCVDYEQGRADVDKLLILGDTN